MSFLVRKIEKAKWLQNDIINGKSVSADAITNCTKTVKNALSTWEISTERDLDLAILALLCGQEHLDTIDVVLINAEEIIERGIEVVSSDGRTSFALMRDKHRDLSKLDYQSLGSVAELIVNELKHKRDKRISQGKQKELLRKAIGEGVIGKDCLLEGVAKYIS